MGPPLRLRGGSLGDLWFDVWRFFFCSPKKPGGHYGVQGSSSPRHFHGVEKIGPGVGFLVKGGGEVRIDGWSGIGLGRLEVMDETN